MLTLDNGESIHVERIGKGWYSTAWKNGSNVYVQTHEDDNAKELLSHLDYPHLPKVEYLAHAGIYRWYRLPLYSKLTAAHKKAWADYKRLKTLHYEAFAAEMRGSGRDELDPQAVNYHLAELVENVPDLHRLGESIRALADACINYGRGWYIEPFQARNCAVDAGGELILLDPVYDYDLLRAKQIRERRY